MQAALSATPDALWVCAALNDRERALARQAARAGSRSCRWSPMPCDGDFDVHMLPIDAQTFRAHTTASRTRPCGSSCTSSSTCPSSRASTPPGGGSGRPTSGTTRRSPTPSPTRPPRTRAVMVQDYHLFLVPRMLRELRPDVRIGFFTHTPWVTAGLLRDACPTTSPTAIVDGMLGADVVASTPSDGRTCSARPRGRCAVSRPTGSASSRWAPTPRRCARSVAAATSTVRCGCWTTSWASGW